MECIMECVPISQAGRKLLLADISGRIHTSKNAKVGMSVHRLDITSFR